MAKVTSPFIAPIHGVAQMDPLFAPDGFLREQVNMISDINKGLYRRPGVKLENSKTFMPKTFIRIVEHNNVDYEVFLQDDEVYLRWYLKITNLENGQIVSDKVITERGIVFYLDTLETDNDLLLRDYQDTLYFISKNRDLIINQDETGVSIAPDSCPVTYDWLSDSFGRLDLQLTSSSTDISFITSYLSGSPIVDLIFYQNRLMFITKRALFASKTGNFSQFYPDDPNVMVESDPILLLVSQAGDALQAMIPFSESILFMGNKEQYTLYHQGMLTFSSLTLLPATSYTLGEARPVKAGSEVFFSNNNQQYSKIFKYLIQPDTQIKVAYELTTNVPKYIPKDISKLIYLDSLDMLVAFTKETPNTLYILQQAYQGNTQVQLAWNKWVFKYPINNIEKSSKDILYIFFNLPNNIISTSLDLISPAPKFCLDFWEEGTISFDDLDREYVFVDVDNYYTEGDPTNYTYTGIPYESYIKLFPWFVKDNSGKPNTEGRLQLKLMEIAFGDTWYMKIINEPYGREVYIREYDKELQSLIIDGYEVPGGYDPKTTDVITETRGVLKMYIGSDASKTNITITSADSMWKMGLLGYTFYGTWQPYSRWGHGSYAGNGGA